MSDYAWKLRKHDAEWQRRCLPWFRRLQLRLCRRVVMAFAAQSVCEAYTRNIINSKQLHEITAIMNRRIGQEENP